MPPLHGGASPTSTGDVGEQEATAAPQGMPLAPHIGQQHSVIADPSTFMKKFYEILQKKKATFAWLSNASQLWITLADGESRVFSTNRLGRFKKKKEVEAYLARACLISLRWYTEDFRDCENLAPAQHPYAPAYYISLLKRHHEETLRDGRIDEMPKVQASQSTFVATYEGVIKSQRIIGQSDPYSSLGHAKHKAALVFLRNASPYSDKAWEFYKLLNDQKQYKVGALIDILEGECTEYKGSQAKYQPALYDTITSMITGGKEKGTRPLCAYLSGFLNSKAGTVASMWYGVHDSRTIQGIALSDHDMDELDRLITTQINNLYPPLQRHQYIVTFHPLTPEVPVARNDWPVEAVALCEEQQRRIEELENRLKGQKGKPNSSDDTNARRLYLIEVMVMLSHAPPITWGGTTPYIRQGSSLTPMPPAEQLARITAYVRTLPPQANNDSVAP